MTNMKKFILYLLSLTVLNLISFSVFSADESKSVSQSSPKKSTDGSQVLNQYYSEFNANTQPSFDDQYDFQSNLPTLQNKNSLANYYSEFLK